MLAGGPKEGGGGMESGIDTSGPKKRGCDHPLLYQWGLVCDNLENMRGSKEQ